MTVYCTDCKNSAAALAVATMEGARGVGVVVVVVVVSVLVEPAHTDVEAAHTGGRICPHGRRCPHERSNMPTCRVEPAHMVECAHI